MLIYITHSRGWVSMVAGLLPIWRQDHAFVGRYIYIACKCLAKYGDVIKWKLFSRNWPFVREILRSPVNSPHSGPVTRTLMFLRCEPAHAVKKHSSDRWFETTWRSCDVIVMINVYHILHFTDFKELLFSTPQRRYLTWMDNTNSWATKLAHYHGNRHDNVHIRTRKLGLLVWCIIDRIAC